MAARIKDSRKYKRFNISPRSAVSRKKTKTNYSNTNNSYAKTIAISQSYDNPFIHGGYLSNDFDVNVIDTVRPNTNEELEIDALEKIIKLESKIRHLKRQLVKNEKYLTKYDIANILELFPDINKTRLEEVETFHQEMATTLEEEIKKEIEQLKKQLDKLGS